MAKATFNLQQFKSEVLSKGVARTNRFEVFIPLPNCLRQNLGDVSVESTRLVNLFCENAIIPQLNIGIVPQRIYGPNYQNPVSVDYGGESITLSFLVDRSMRVKNFFDKWMRGIVDPNTYNLTYQKDTSKGYTVEMMINQLDEQDNITYSIKLEDAFPRNIGLMDLNMASQNTPHKLNVTFAYRRWKYATEISNRTISIANAAERAIDLGIAT